NSSSSSARNTQNDSDNTPLVDYNDDTDTEEEDADRKHKDRTYTANNKRKPHGND
ncbi:hypothetical protein BG006_008291, partial [Podila minutissima]